jgi:hypothetical protein
LVWLFLSTKCNILVAKLKILSYFICAMQTWL